MTTQDPFNLQRFLYAQENNYTDALREIKPFSLHKNTQQNATKIRNFKCHKNIQVFAHFKINHYICSKLSDNRFMSATDYLNNAKTWLAQQSQRTIDYQWEIQHHNQMHKTYETSL